jgi:peptidoglycan biosynthesis protein MviN/MurJ (putative lipid II flippase)
VTRHLKSPGARAFAGTAIGSAPGFVLPFVIAAHLGAGRATDAFAFAFAVALFVLGLATGVLEANLLPQADGYRRAGGAALRGYVRRTLPRVAAVAALSYLTIAIGAAALLAIRSDFAPDERVAVLVCLAALAPLVVTAALNSCQAVALYVSDDFLAPTASQAARAIVPLSVIWLIGDGYPAVETIALLLAGGELIRFWILRRRVARVAARTPVNTEFAPQLSYRAVARTSVPHALNMLILVANPLVDRLFAAGLAAGALTVLDLGEKTFFAPQMLITSSLVLVAGARWSNADLADAATAESYRRAVRRTLAAAGLTAVIAIAALVVAGHLARDQLASAHLALAVPIAACLLIGLPFESVSILSARLMTSTRRTGALPLFAAAGFVTNAVGDFVGARLFGILGIAAATVLVRIATAALFVPHCRRLTAPRRNSVSAPPAALPLLRDANAPV